MIYFIEAKGTGAIKIGYAADTATRLADLQTGNHCVLRVVEEFVGSRVLEGRIHRALGFAAIRREWFYRGPACGFLRLARRIGLEAACAGYERVRDRTRNSAAIRAESGKRLIGWCVRWMAGDLIKQFGADNLKGIVGGSAATWQNARAGRNIPEAHLVLASLAVNPKYVSQMLRVTSGMSIAPLSAVVAEADRVRAA